MNLHFSASECTLAKVSKMQETYVLLIANKSTVSLLSLCAAFVKEQGVRIIRNRNRTISLTQVS